MKTPEQFLRDVIKYFPDDYVIDTPDEGISIHSIIAAMEEYAIQSVECAKDSIEKIKEDNPAISEAAAYEIQEAWEKVHALEDDLHNLETQIEEIKLYNKNINDELRKADSHNLDIAAKLSAKDRTIGRLENDLSDGVKILETIWLAFDRDYLMKSLLASDYENLKNYLGK